MDDETVRQPHSRRTTGANNADDATRTLVEIAELSVQAGDFANASTLLDTCIHLLAGEEREIAQVLWAEALFGLGDNDQAVERLTELRRSRPTEVGALLAGELLAEHKEWKPALRWFNIALGRLTAEEILDEDMRTRHTQAILNGRCAVRQQLGLVPDELDELVISDEELSPFIDPDDIDLVSRPTRIRVLYWPRDQWAAVQQRWPDLVSKDADEFFPQRESDNRELAQKGHTIGMIPLTVAGLLDYIDRNGGDPLDSKVRHACMEEIAERGEVYPWPPERNDPCWCRSGRKYKRCCG